MTIIPHRPVQFARALLAVPAIADATGRREIRPISKIIDGYTADLHSDIANNPVAAEPRDQLSYSNVKLFVQNGHRVTQVLRDAAQATFLGKRAPNAILSEVQITAARLPRP